MKFSTLVAIASALAGASATCTEVSGNYYCNEVSKVVYKNVGFSGSFDSVTAMDEDTGSCSSESMSFSGSLSPLDDELSLHFRGPLKLLQFGVYYPASGSSNEKRDDEDCSTTQHVHHKHVKRATAMVTETVYVDQNGNTVTGTMPATSSAAAATSAAAAAASSSAAPAAAAAASSSAAASSAAASSSAAAAASSSTDEASEALSADDSSSTASAAAGDWTRASYYVPGSTTNVTFLNYYGGSGSGVWSSAFGNSLSYANSDNSGASSSAVALEETTIGSDTEYVVMSGLKCGDDDEEHDCGFYRAGIPAYHGWNGQEKIFVFEFEMPSSSDTGFNGDMPAVWMLNARIPRTLQYGDSSCSCWATGCGELDLFEILSTGEDKCITTLHDEQGAVDGSGGGGGSSDYFARPTSGSVKAAVIFTGLAIHIQYVDDDFDSVLSADTVQGWVDTTGTTVTLTS